jgi:glycosyltransferase involved in cell wall biosynthesis
MKQSSISVVIPNYNHGEYIGAQLDALTAQSVLPLEVIVVEDASTDDSARILEEYARLHPLVRLIRHDRNQGVNAALTTGLEACRGELYYAGAADDLVEPGFIESIDRMTERFPQAGIYFGMYRAVDPEEREIGVKNISRWHEEMYATPEVFLKECLELEHCTNSLSPSTVYRKRYIEEIGGYRPELGHWADTFITRAIGLKYGAGYTPEVLATMRWMPHGFSSSQARNVRLMLDIVARAAWLMRSPEFRDRFPAAHVAGWEKAYRDYVIWTHLWRQHEPVVRVRNQLQPAGPDGENGGSGLLKYPLRCWARLVFSYHWRRLQAYVPDLSCYSENNGMP